MNAQLIERNKILNDAIDYVRSREGGFWNHPEKISLKMRLHLFWRGYDWKPMRLTQSECKELGFLSGERDEYYCYNPWVQYCGDVIRFTQNTIDDSAVRVKYRWFDCSKWKN